MAIPLSVISGSNRVGRGLARIGLLVTPEELQVPEIVSRRDALCPACDTARRVMRWDTWRATKERGTGTLSSMRHRLSARAAIRIRTG